MTHDLYSNHTSEKPRRSQASSRWKGWARQAITALAAVTLVCGLGCKKKQGDDPTPQARRAAPKKPALFDPGAFDRALARPEKADPMFAKVKQQLPTVAKKCKASKKYLSSFTWCNEWKQLKASLKPAFKAMQRNNPGSAKQAVAIALAGVSVLRDPDPFVRYAGLQVIEQVMYQLAWKRIRSPRPTLARVVANLVKTGDSHHERKQAVRLLGNDGGTAYFRGGIYDGKILSWAAHNDKSHWVRRAALGHLRSCVKRRQHKCQITPDVLKAWYAKETDGTAKESIARIAGMFGMTDEVFAWCTPRLLSSKLHWGCREAFKSVIDKGNFEKFHSLAEKFRDSDKSKTRNNFRMAYVVELMRHGLKKGFPKDNVVAFLRSVLSQPATANARSRGTTSKAVKGLVKLANSKKEIKATRRFLKKLRRTYKKAKKGDKYQERWLKIFDQALDTLKQKA